MPPRGLISAGFSSHPAVLPLSSGQPVLVPRRFRDFDIAELVQLFADPGLLQEEDVEWIPVSGGDL